MRKILQTKIIAMLIVMISIVSGRAQWINSISHVPANPTSADTIYFFADLSFPSGNCNEHSDIYLFAPPYIGVSTLHCLGSLTFICSHTDTFKFDPLPAGSYTFFLHVNAGALPSPCTPGIVQGPTDSVLFTVSSSTAVPQIKNGKKDLLIFPNPAGSTVKLHMSDEIVYAKNKSLAIYSVEGKEIGSWKLEDRNAHNEFDISYLPNGIYFCRVIAENSVSDKIKLIVIK